MLHLLSPSTSLNLSTSFHLPPPPPPLSTSLLLFPVLDSLTLIDFHPTTPSSFLSLPPSSLSFSSFLFSPPLLLLLFLIL